MASDSPPAAAPTPSRLPLLALQIAVFLGALALVVLAHGGIGGFNATFDAACDELVCDYTRHYVPTAEALSTTGKPTWGYVYPATLAILVAPLTWIPGHAWIWAALLVLAQAALGVLPPHLLPNTPPRLALAFSALSALAVPTLQVLSWGQVSALLVLAGLLAYYLASRAAPLAATPPSSAAAPPSAPPSSAATPAPVRQALSGGLLGLAIAVKLYPALLLPWLVLRRRWLAAAVSLATLVVLGLALPLVVLGPSGTWTFHEAVVTELVRLIPGFGRSIGPQSLTAVVQRLLLGPDSALAPVVTGVAVLLGLGQLAVLLVLPRRRPHDAWIWAFVLAYGAFPLFLASSWLHYFGHLPIVWLLLGRALLTEDLERRLGVGVLGGASVLLGLWPTWIGLGTPLYPALGILLFSHLAGLASLLLVVFDPGVRHGPATAVDTAPAAR